MEFSISGETTGAFIEVSPNSLDFGACVFSSVYQLSFMVYNKANIPHGIGIKFPSCLKQYLSASENDVYIPPNSNKKISIRFIPRKEIIFKDEITYYNCVTKILEFPIYVAITSKNFSDVPSTKVKVFAILTEANGLTLRPTPEEQCWSLYQKPNMNAKHCRIEDAVEYCLDLGECTTKETVFVEVELTNNSLVFQNHGFLDLPECIKILPNFGFGEIFPSEIKKLILTFSPEAKDIPKSPEKCETTNYTFTYPLSVNSIKNIGGIGQIKKPFKYQYIRNSLAITEKELERKLSSGLLEDIESCLSLLKSEDILELFKSSSFEQSNESFLHEEILCTSLKEEEIIEQEEEPLNIMSSTIWIKATIIDPLCELSHQYIEFPDTPCGSYSVMNITLQAFNTVGDLKCWCGYAKKFSTCKKHIEYSVHFEIVGDNKEISIEQTCGKLESGQEVTLTLVARPQLPEDIIIETATELKREQLLQQKILEWESKQRNESAMKTGKLNAAKGKKEKKTDKGKKEKKTDKRKANTKEAKKASVQQMPEFVVEDKEIVLDYLDMYPAEMVAWKNMEPYYIEAKFCCTLTYNSIEITRNPEKLFFTALCKVIRPSFVINLNTQHIDFGLVTVGATARKVLSIQNIQYEPIKPTLTSLSPTGFFTCPCPRNIVLPPQHLLQLPVKFTPLEEQHAVEYFEIKAGSTICPLIVSGDGMSRNIKINPDFVVCRLEAKTGDFADCAIEINNQGSGLVTIEFVKLCELVGEIKPIEKEPVQDDKSKKPLKGSKTKPNTKGKKGNVSSKKSKFTQELTEDEEDSLKNNFAHKEGESYFEILGATDNSVDVPPLSKKSIKIHFGVPLPPESAQVKKGKKGAGKKAKPTKQSGPRKYYVAKYNLMLGKTTFLRDAIIIATFI